MFSVKVKLVGHNIMEVPQGTTILDVASSLQSGAELRWIGAKMDENIVDLRTSIDSDCTVELIPVDTPAGLVILRRTAAFVLGHVLSRMGGANHVRLGMGDCIGDGFYYDVEIERSISVEDLPRIQRNFEQMVAQNLPIKRCVMSCDEAVQLFTDLGESYKAELVEEERHKGIVVMYQQGCHWDLSNGPLASAMTNLKAVTLSAVSGVYWRGRADAASLQRVYGVAFSSKEALEAYLLEQDERKRRDHRKLAKDLDLFLFTEEAPGMPLYLPKGLTLRNQIENYERELQKRDYVEVRTPVMMHERLWNQSGHTAHYQENMYFIQDAEERFALKPMSCPGHMLIYKSKMRSYRELPLRLAEYGLCHRRELSGALSGMMRVRAFTQDDAHIFLAAEQIQQEIQGILRLIDEIYQALGFDYYVELSTRPDDALGDSALWERAERALGSVLHALSIPYQVNAGDGAFYGPKIDIHIEDALGRRWQCGTIQLDFQLPERFDLSYVDESGQQQRPIVIHRAVFGSMERFLGILIEHFAGAFPLWLAPLQVIIIPVKEAHRGAAVQLQERLESEGIRVQVDDRSEKMGYKIRHAQAQKVPITMVIGEKEIAGNTVTIRRFGERQTSESDITQAIEDILAQVQQKKF